MRDLFFILVSVVILRGVITNFFLLNSIQWLRKYYLKFSSPPSSYNGPWLFLFIPALLEQKRIIPTIKYFTRYFLKGAKIKLVIVTTEKEQTLVKNLSQTTHALVSSFLKKSPGIQEKVLLLNYPKKHGKMAHQLNFAVKAIERRLQLLPEKVYLGFYNADSRPHPKTLNGVLNLVNLNFREPLLVAQQSSIFTKNFLELERNKNIFLRTFLQASAIFQTRWTLAHEIPRFLRQSKIFGSSSFLQKYALTHCVGHGLFLRLDFLKQLGYFSQETVTEDIFLGFLIRALGKRIEPIPLLESAESPSSIFSLMRQKYVWFWGPLDYPRYLWSFKKHFPKKFSQNKFRVLILSSQGIITTFAWFISSLIFIFLFLYPLLSSIPALYLLLFISLCFYNFSGFFLVCHYLPRLSQWADQRVQKLRFSETIWILLQSIPCILTHSFPTYLTILMLIREKVFQKPPPKPKT